MGVRTSFTFKQSALQRPPDNETADDTALRGDDYGRIEEPPRIPAPNYSTSVSYSAESFLSVDVIDYGAVELSWSIGASLSSTLTATPQATEILIRFSTAGEPRTAQDGAEVTRITPGIERYKFVHEGLPPGRWVYYSLFVKYESNDDTAFYERVATLKTITPINFGSTDLLWNSIPEHYRINDGTDSSSVSVSSPLYNRGPLYRLLSAFGWDLDRMRTLVRYQMLAKDPDLANDEVLDALTYELGIPISSRYLGTDRLRNIVRDIGYLREFKGTLEGTREWLTAITGSDVVIKTVNGNAIPTASSITTTTNPTNVPNNATEWVVEGSGFTAASVAGGVRISRASGTGDIIVCAKRLVSNVSQAAQYRVYVDMTARTNSDFLGVLLSPTITAASTVAVTAGSISSAPSGLYLYQTFDTDDWYGAPINLGFVGNGTFTTAPMYLHLFVRLGDAASEITLSNLGLFADNRYPYEIDIYSQRLNLIRDPQFNYGPNSAYWSMTGNGTVVAYGSGRSIGASLSTNSSVTFMTGASTTPIQVGTPYYFSVIDRYDNLQECSLYSAEFGLLAKATTPSSSFPFSNGGARKSWELLRPYDIPWLPVNLSDCYLVLTGIASTGESVEISEPLLEPLRINGEYFDGDGIRGGWLSTTEEVGVSDYRWGDGGQHVSFSYYTAEYQRTVDTVTNLMDTLIPVTQSNDPSATLNFDRVYGYTGSDRP